MALVPGRRIGPYEIAAQIGVGGMGEVYRATDTKLKRDVAIKVLPATVAADAERLARFQREAELLASLNHPHIAAIYGLEESADTKALVMELVEGETLAERLTLASSGLTTQGSGIGDWGSGLPVDEALAIAMQIAEALEAAHERGIVHRDLKPANVKVRSDGTVKVLDFGLARAIDPGSGTRNPGLVDFTQAPTITSPAMTQPGVILGTAAYMAPEQARGTHVDKRADIWAFGAVLYEMLSGMLAFPGESTTDVLAAVVRAEPDWTALPPSLSPTIRRLLRRCLEKDRRKRLPDIGVARLDIEESAAEPPTTASVPASDATGPRRWTPVVLSLVVGAFLATAVWWVRAEFAGPARAPTYLSVALAPGAEGVRGLGLDDPLAISPDGEWIVYIVVRDDRSLLYLRNLHEADGRLIDGTDGARNPFFSPNGQWIAFGTMDTLKKVPVSGGAPVTVSRFAGGDGFNGGAWGPDDEIVFVPQFNGGLWTVSAGGGEPRLLLDTDAQQDRIAFLYPQVLPDGRGVLVSMMSARAKTADDFVIAVLEPGQSTPRVLVTGGSNARYLPATEHLVYLQGGALFAVPFDLAQLAVTGTPRRVVDGVATGDWGYGLYAVARNGTLVYDPGHEPSRPTRLAVVDRDGRLEPITDDRTNPADFAISPDGSFVVTRSIAANDELWIYDLARSTALPLTSEPPDEVFPLWTADGARVVFGTRTGGIYSMLADGTGPRETLSTGEYGRYPASFSRGEGTLAFVETHPSTRRDIWLLALDGDRAAQPLLNSAADEWAPKFSPDGRWLAYVSDESGRAEVYLRPAGATGGRRQISSEGGTWPAWGRDGELFFSRNDSILSVRLDERGNPFGAERVVVASPRLGDLPVDALDTLPFYDLMPDGRFMVRFRPVYAPAQSFTVVLDWFDELERLAPAE